jgi:hypothetical protein
MSRKNRKNGNLPNYDKASKKKRREMDKQKRGDWGNTNPITKIQGNKNDYRRRKQKEREDDLSDYDYNFD